jgi:leucyl-tRNA synthetase
MATKCKDYDFHQIEPYWQSFWETNGAFRADDSSPLPKYYLLDMFPYPSGTGLHVGHPEGYTATDIIARWRRASGYKVLHPMGWDAFGLPAEQHAVKTGTHPAANTAANIANFKRQIQSLGFSYDWEREIDTTDPRYVRWTQWIFLQLFRRGLAYVDERPVWWCPELRTVLANEEVTDGRSEVGGFPVERRNLRQWVLRITAYADRLLAGLKAVDWPDSTKRMQEAWIGRSEGAEVTFALEHPEWGELRIYTTRVDTLFGCTYMVLAPEHPLVEALTAPRQTEAVGAYRQLAAAKSDLERTDLAKDKTGVFTGSYAINPINQERVPIWIADYVLSGYGTGAIMAVPAHDARDNEFATKYGLEIREVVERDGRWMGLDPAAPPGKPRDVEGGVTWVLKQPDGRIAESWQEGTPFTSDQGTLINSGPFSGTTVADAKPQIIACLQASASGQAAVNYKLRDWLFSRQRYWGEPFPIVWVGAADYAAAAAARPADFPSEPVTFASGGRTHYALPLPDPSLPLTLPDVVSYLPGEGGESPLANVTDWLELWINHRTGETVPGSAARPVGHEWIRGRRETNTMPQWAGSCWYYLRFTDPHDERAFASQAALATWGVPDLYVGGAEHAVLHLLYARFWHMVLFDLGAVPTSEPFPRLFHQGIILGEDGEKMSKSRGNVVNPDVVVASHGADTLRLYLMFLGPLEAAKPWNPRGIEGVHRFLQKAWRECIGPEGGIAAKVRGDADESPALQKLLHETIRKVGDDIENLRFNTAISSMMIWVNAAQKEPAIRPATLRTFLQLLAPFAPHLAEELWERLGGPAPIQASPWPTFDPKLLANSEIRLVVQVNGKYRTDLSVPAGISQDDAVKRALAHPKVAPLIAGRSIKRIVFVPNKILNLVAIDQGPAPAE